MFWLCRSSTAVGAYLLLCAKLDLKSSRASIIVLYGAPGAVELGLGLHPLDGDTCALGQDHVLGSQAEGSGYGVEADLWSVTAGGVARVMLELGRGETEGARGVGGRQGQAKARARQGRFFFLTHRVSILGRIILHREARLAVKRRV